MPRPSLLARCCYFPENRAALLAVQDLARSIQADGIRQAPILVFLHGPTGVGKSHLVQALAQDLSSSSQPAAIRSAADFRLSPGLAAKSQETLQPLIDEAVQADLWVLEDVQHLPVAAGEVVVSILDRRQAEEMPTVLTASRGPQQLRHRGQTFASRLTSRLAAGLVIRLDPWQAASRLAFLQELGQRRQLAVAPEIFAWLAKHLTGSGRSLAGAVEQVATLHQLRHPLDLETVEEHFHAQIESGQPTLPHIARHVCRHFQVEPAQLQSPGRSPSILWPRQVGMFLARRLTKLSLDKIGAYFGGRDHTTVSHACRKVEHVLAADPIRSGAVHSLQADLT